MANDLSRNPWFLDTVGVITTDKIRVKSLRWYAKAASAGDDIQVEDNNGEIIWISVASGANYTEAELLESDCDGFELAVIDAGILYVRLM